MGRNKKIEVPEEELTALDNNELNAKDLAQKYEQPRSYFDNLKHKRKLKTSFELKTADQSMSNQQMKQPDLNQNTPQEGAEVAPQINYHMAVKGLYKGADSIFKIMAVMSRGQIEYIGCNDQELEDLANITENDPVIQKVSTFGGVSTVVTISSIVGTFGSKVKFVKKVKHDPNNIDCKCKKCESLRKVFEKDTVNPDEKVTDITNVRRNIEEKSKTEKLADDITNSFKEDVKVNSAGMIIEKNAKSPLSEDQVIKQNSKEPDNYGGA
jgi:hypothetical protein